MWHGEYDILKFSALVKLGFKKILYIPNDFEKNTIVITN